MTQRPSPFEKMTAPAKITLFTVLLVLLMVMQNGMAYYVAQFSAEQMAARLSELAASLEQGAPAQEAAAGIEHVKAQHAALTQRHSAMALMTLLTALPIALLMGVLVARQIGAEMVRLEQAAGEGAAAEFLECPCGGLSPVNAVYCCQCGQRLEA